jgi:hypothetical protein
VHPERSENGGHGLRGSVPIAQITVGQNADGQDYDWHESDGTDPGDATDRPANGGYDLPLEEQLPACRPRMSPARRRACAPTARPRSREAPKRVRSIISQCNRIVGKRYKWGGGHARRQRLRLLRHRRRRAAPGHELGR